MPYLCLILHEEVAGDLKYLTHCGKRILPESWLMVEQRVEARAVAKGPFLWVLSGGSASPPGDVGLFLPLFSSFPSSSSCCYSYFLLLCIFLVSSWCPFPLPQSGHGNSKLLKDSSVILTTCLENEVPACRGYPLTAITITVIIVTVILKL